MDRDDASSRFAMLEATLLRNKSESGSWPHWLDVEDASTSLVGTAHGLAMLRMRGYEFHEPDVQKPLLYLARQVRVHTRRDQRGEYSRYPAYALWGLMRYPGALAEKEIFEGAKFSANWLIRKARPSGGWSVKGHSDEERLLSLPATMPAVLGLDRFAPYARGDLGRKCIQCSRDARAAIAAAAVGSGEWRFWRQLPGGEACPGATSLAVLTLAGGTKEERDLAGLGINYLLANPDDWTTQVHDDQQLKQLIWRIMTFSVGLRAVLHPCARQKVNDDVVRAVVAHMDSLWSEEGEGWAFVQGGIPTTTGSYAVAAAVRALKNASEFDPFAQYLGKKRFRPTAARKVKGSRNGGMGAQKSRRIDVWEAERKITIKVENPPGQEFSAKWDARAKSQWATLMALLKRQVHAQEVRRQKAAKENDRQSDATLSVAALMEYSQGKAANAKSVERTIKRINAKVAETAWEAKLHFQYLIEPMAVGDSEVDMEYGMEETEVVFHS